MEISKSQGNENLPLEQHAKKLRLFAELMAKGVYSAVQAAKEAGYADSVANGRSHEWLGKSRSTAKYPILWDYYESLRKENLREFDVDAKSISDELAKIAFSDISNFIDLPKKEYELRSIHARRMEAAVWRVKSWPDAQAQYRRDMAQYTTDCERQDQQRPGTKKKKLVQPQTPEPPTAEQLRMAEEWNLMTEDQRINLMYWKDYRPGSIRLKNLEDIPKALLPVIAEIRETRDGIAIKLHNKLDALDKLARWQKMYTADINPEGESNIVQEITVNVKGSKSQLRISGSAEEAAA